MSHKQSINKQNIKAVILAGSQDFGRCPVASRLPVALWPVVDKPALERLLRHLSRQGIKQATVCSNGNAELLQSSITSINSMQVKLLDEALPTGTAGCIRDATGGETDALLLVFPASIVSPPKIDALLGAHRNGKSDLTVVLNPSQQQGNSGVESAGIYALEPSILEYIPKKGYCDIKEGLVPEVLRAGKNIYAAKLVTPVGNFRNREEYLYAIANYLENASKESFNSSTFKRTDSQTLWIASNAKVDSSTRIYGPVVIMNGATISKQSIIFGPAIIGRNASIGKDSLIVNSILWDGAQVGRNCEIQSCLLDNNAIIPNNSVVEEQAVPYKRKTILQTAVSKTVRFSNNKVNKFQPLLQSNFEKAGKLTNWFTPRNFGKNILTCFATVVLSIAFIWSYWPGIIDLWNIWQRSDEYSSGLLVPFLALYILWVRRRKIARVPIQPSIWGLLAFIAVQALRHFGLFFMYSSAERLSLVLSIASLTLFLFGWRLFRKISPVLLFLCLMLPFPRSIHNAVMLPLQNLATTSAVVCLEMMGYAVTREGNIIHLNGTTVAVSEACNGLRMVTAFFVIIGWAVLLVQRAWWEKLIVLISSLPVALLCNVARLTITAIAFTMLAVEKWERIFHHFGGYAMMPLALAAVVAELWLLTKLTTLPVKEEAIIITRQKR